MSPLALLKNKWFRLVAMPCAIYFCSTYYYGWQYLYRLLIAEGTFSWVCDECTENTPGYDPEKGICLTPDDPEQYFCDDQENKVQSLYTIMSSMEFVAGIIAGALYDLVGYRISLVIGYILNIVGIFCVCQSTKAVPLYYLGAVCSGLAVNINAYPAYFIRAYFPKNGDSALLLLFTAQWAGSSIMKFVYDGTQNGGLSFRIAQPVFSLVGLPFVIVYYFCLPKSKNSHRQELISAGLLPDLEVRKTQIKDVMVAFKQWDVPCFAFLYYLPLVMAHNAYFTCVDYLAGDHVSEILGNVQAWQFAICIGLAGLSVLGSKSPILKWFPYGLVMVATILGTLSLVIGGEAGESETWRITAAVIFCIGNTYIYASKYIYAEMTIDDAVYGLVCGVISTVTGALQLTNVAWRKIAVNDNNLHGFMMAYAIITLFSCALGIFLFYRVHKNKIWFLKYIVSPIPDERRVLEEGAIEEPKSKSIEVSISRSSSSDSVEAKIVE